MQTAVALGTFDGLHDGHRAVLQQILPFEHSVAVTFDLPPKMQKENPAVLMLPETKHEALHRFGIQEIIVLDFEAVCSLSPQAFLDDLRDRLHPSVLACGFNYRFGKNAAGDAAFLKQYGEQHGIRVLCVPAVFVNGQPISSTAIRQLLASGDVEAANRLLFGGFRFTAPVLHGDARGRTLRIPTVNQRYPDGLAPLKYGVYAAEAVYCGKRYQGVCNIGIRPTFETQAVFAETHIFDFDQEIYGRDVTLFPRKFLREERRFDSPDDLKNAILLDKKAALAYFKGKI